MAETSLFHGPLTEKYRPRCWDEIVAQDKIVGQIRSLIGRGALSGRAYWLSGPSSCGKSTVARLLAKEIADDFCTIEVDATGLTVAELADLEKQSRLMGFGEKTGRAFIVNEAHGLRKDVIRQLLVVLERIPRHCVWVFTTTNDQEEALFEDLLDASPLLSRCVRLQFSRRNVARAFAERAKWIAEQEGLDGREIGAYLELVNQHRSNLRAVLNEIEAGRMMAE